MPPRNRGNQVPSGFQSKSTPNLQTAPSLAASSSVPGSSIADAGARLNGGSPSPGPGASPSGATSVEDGIQDEEQTSFGLDGSSGSASSSGEDMGERRPPSTRPLYTSRSHTHLPPHTSALFPPFYNRPPTPLPPSPSLTSLLRPSFSTQTSRPTTPDSSDVDAPSGSGMGTATTKHGTSTPASSTNLASITKSARHAPNVPRASPKVPTYEYYGFALYLASSAAFLMYILWAYVPSPLLHQMGIHYYPNRWWALAVPAWLVVTVVYIYVALASYNTQHLTLPMSSCENLVDECAQVAVVDRRSGKIVRERGGGSERESKSKGGASGSRSNSFSAYPFGGSDGVDWTKLWSTGTDAVMDVPIGGVCEILYGVDQDGSAG